MANETCPEPDHPTDLDRWNQAGAVFGLPPDTLIEFYLYTVRVHTRA